MATYIRVGTRSAASSTGGNGTSAILPQTAGATATPASFVIDWLLYFAFESDIGANAVKNEPFTKAHFQHIEKLAPFWDATNPDRSAFGQAGRKLILWQGEVDRSLPTITSMVYYRSGQGDARP